jgi:SET family sugar efflux transporter-like MFS transporter
MNLNIWKRVLTSKFGAALGLCIFLEGIVLAIGSPLLPIVLSNRIGMDKGNITIFYLLNTIVGIVVLLVSGYLSDGVVARYKLVIVAGIVGATGYIGLALATQPIVAFIAGPLTVAISIFFSQLFAVAKAGVVDEWSRDDQVMGIAALRTLFSLGFIIGTALASVFAQIIPDIQLVFFLIGGAMYVLTILIAVVIYRVEIHIRESVLQHGVRDMGTPHTPETGVALPLYALVIPLLALTLLRGADSTRGVYLSLVMFQLFHDASIAPLLFGITAAAELITMSLLSQLSSRIGEKNAIAVGAVVGALYFVVMTFSQSLPVFYAIHVVYGIFNAALLGVAMAYVQGLLARRAGLGGSLYLAVMNVGSLLGILSPLLIQGYSQMIFVIPAILCLSGMLLLLFGDRTTQIEKRLRAEANLPSAERTQEPPTSTGEQAKAF